MLGIVLYFYVLISYYPEMHH